MFIKSLHLALILSTRIKQIVYNRIQSSYMNQEVSEALEKLGDTIKLWRQFKHLSKEQLARATGVTRLYLSEIEIGKRNPSVIVLLKLCKGLNITLSQLVRGPLKP